MKKVIWPDYQVINEGNYVEIFAYVRKQNNIDKQYYLIPVRTRYEFNDPTKKDFNQVIHSFIESCYNVLICYIIELNKPNDWIFFNEKDTSQQKERYRLRNWLNINVKVL